jgi:amino acid transporter, AAT family
MNFVVLTAALSCIDTGIYATSRIFYSLASEGYFPPIFARLHPQRRTPIFAVVASTSVLYLGAIMSLYSPKAYTWLACLSGFGFLFSWLMIALSQPLIRKSVILTNPQNLKWKVPFYPYTQYIAVLLILAIFVGLFFSEDGRKIVLAGFIWFVFARIYYYIRKTKM